MAPKTRRRASTKAPTTADVARLAGASLMSVSRVVNLDPNVSPVMRQKVQAAIDMLNYVPNQEARRLAGRAPICIGMLYTDPVAGYFHRFLIGLLNKASSRDVRLVVQRCDVRHDWGPRVADMLASGIDGFILPPPLCESRPLLKLLADGDTPVVVISSGRPPEGVCAVGIDDYQGAYDMTCHLLRFGHSRLGFITGSPWQSSSQRRLQGFRAAMNDAGLHFDEKQVVAEGMFTYRSGLEAAEKLLSQARRPTAIFASNDDMAAAAIAVAHRRQMDVPSDLTVVGFDDAPLATTIWPELTTVRQPIPEMADAALNLLVRQIRARRAGEPRPCEHTWEELTLVRRQSDAVPRIRPPYGVGFHFTP